MVKRIFSSYNSEEEAIEGIKELQEKGYMADELLLISNKDKRLTLEENTDVEIKSSPATTGSGDSLVDKIKRVFTLENDSDGQDTTAKRLAEYGLSEEQASHYALDVEDGKILIAADESSAGSTIRPLADPNLDPVATSGSFGKVTGKHGLVEDTHQSPVVPSSKDSEPSLESTHPSKENRFS